MKQILILAFLFAAFTASAQTVTINSACYEDDAYKVTVTFTDVTVSQTLSIAYYSNDCPNCNPSGPQQQVYIASTNGVTGTYKTTVTVPTLNFGPIGNIKAGVRNGSNIIVATTKRVTGEPCQ